MSNYIICVFVLFVTRLTYALFYSLGLYFILENQKLYLKLDNITTNNNTTHFWQNSNPTKTRKPCGSLCHEFGKVTKIVDRLVRSKDLPTLISSIKPVHAVTSIKQSPVLKSPFFFVPKVTSYYRHDCISPMVQQM